MIRTVLGKIIKTVLMCGDPNKEIHIGKNILPLDITDDIQRSIYLGTYESTETQWLHKNLKPGMIFIDAGANIGYYSLLAASLVGETGKVYSFEPGEFVYEKLKSTIQKNKIKNISLHRLGLSDCNDERDLYLTNPNNYSPTFCLCNYPTCKEFKPECIGKSSLTTLDIFTETNGIKFIDMIKIDVDGYEPNVLRGMTNLLKQNRVHRIMIEFAEYYLISNNSSSKKLDELLISLGFKLESKKMFHCTKEELSIGNFLYVNERWLGDHHQVSGNEIILLKQERLQNNSDKELKDE